MPKGQRKYNGTQKVEIIKRIHRENLSFKGASTKTSTLPYLAFQYQNQNCPQASNCVAIVMFSIVFLVYALANIFGDADLAKSMAG